MARRVIWTPKLHAPQGNRDPLRWCRLGKHIFIPYKVKPRTKVCTYCRTEERE